MSDGWHPISDDGKRMITREPFGFAIYSINDDDDPKAETRDFVHRGVVGDFVHAEQWLKDGKVQGHIVKIFVEKPAKVKSGSA